MNLIFNSIEINNFLSIKNASISFIDQGIVLIEGINNDTSPVQSNGSGKSSIFDAILWTLYGETLRGASDVHNKNTSEGTCCILDFDYDNTNYRLVRYRQDSIHKNDFIVYKNSELLYNTIKKSQDYIENLLSISSAKVLGSIILLGQGLPYKFSSLSQTARKDMLEELTGSSEYIEDLQRKLSLKKIDCEKDINNLQKSKYEKTGSKNSLSSVLEDLIKEKESKKSKEEINEEIEQNKNKITEIDKNIKSVEDSINKMQNELTTYRNAMTNNNKFQYSLDNEIKNLKSSLDSLQTKCPLCGREYDSAEDIEKHRSEIILQINDKQNQSNIIADKISKYQKLYDDIYGKVVHNYSIRDELGQDKYELNLSIDSLKLEVSKLDNNDTRIDSINDTINKLDIEISDLDSKIEERNYYLNHINWLSREVSREFKGVLLSDSVNLLSERVSHYAEYLIDGTVTLSLQGNKLCIDLDDIPYENLSGGERQRVDLSIQFALRDVLFISTGFSSNILVLDEIFDNLDVQGCERLSNLVASEFNSISSIYIVTHHTDFNIIYDKKIVIAKTGGTSAINELG